MLPDRVSNPGPLTRVRCPIDCATRPGTAKLARPEAVYIYLANHAPLFFSLSFFVLGSIKITGNETLGALIYGTPEGT